MFEKTTVASSLKKRSCHMGSFHWEMPKFQIQSHDIQVSCAYNNLTLSLSDMTILHISTTRRIIILYLNTKAYYLYRFQMYKRKFNIRVHYI